MFRLVVWMLFLAVIYLGCASNIAHAQSCVINDHSDTSLNVRDRPNGKVINRLRNGRQVKIDRTQNDSKGRPWGYATGNYNGKNRNWGWVFMQSVNCGEGATRSDRASASGKGRSCVIQDRQDTSLNVRDVPNGTVINRLRNGRKVKIHRTRNDAKGRPWGYATGQFKGRNRNWGWVFMGCCHVKFTKPQFIHLVKLSVDQHNR